jgi:hypothetical protein
MDSVKKSARPALGSLSATQEKFIHLKYYHEFILLQIDTAFSSALALASWAADL